MINYGSVKDRVHKVVPGLMEPQLRSCPRLEKVLVSRLDCQQQMYHIHLPADWLGTIRINTNNNDNNKRIILHCQFACGKSWRVATV